MPIPGVGSGGYTWPVTLNEAKAQLNIPTSDTSSDAELQGYIDAATETVEGIIGTVTAATYTDSFVTDPTNPWPYHYGTWPRYSYNSLRTVDLRHGPVQSVQSVSVSSMDGSNAVTLTAGSYRVDYVNGSITVIDSSVFGPQVTVAYTAGRSTVPAGIRLAALLLIEHLWEQTQRGGGAGRSVPGGEPAPDIGYGPSKETQALAMLERYRANVATVA